MPNAGGCKVSIGWRIDIESLLDNDFCIDNRSLSEVEEEVVVAVVALALALVLAFAALYDPVVAPVKLVEPKIDDWLIYFDGEELFLGLYWLKFIFALKLYGKMCDTYYVYGDVVNVGELSCDGECEVILNIDGDDSRDIREL